LIPQSHTSDISADSFLQRFAARIRTAGVMPTDDPETRLSKALLMFATGLFTLTTVLWVIVYFLLGQHFSTTLPFVFQLLLVGNMLLYLYTNNFDFFRISQLSLFLFLPFVAQWAAGNFISASGLILWGLLAPIGALLCIGVKQSLGWFIAWTILTGLSGAMDYYLADPILTTNQSIDIRTSITFFALNFICVASVIYALLCYAIKEKRSAQFNLEKTYHQLQIEQERAEKLLLNILPAPIAERLKASNQPIVDGFADVTIMFADLVNFTQTASSLAPAQVFAMLNDVFSVFDELAEKYNLEKIKTIGDAYMVAGGLDNGHFGYTENLADMAIDMINILQGKKFYINNKPLEIRIGIGTGPVVAGVVGKKKFIYDLWGDTVNLASRLTSESAPSLIQCDATTYRRLASKFEFELPPRIVKLKGKGDMEVYRLIKRHP
jgi:class 3 adenylate cyclase